MSNHIRRYKYTTEQNLELIEDALKGLQEIKPWFLMKRLQKEPNLMGA
jgi:hypothetical protein